LTRGAEKYAPRNWEKGMAWSKVVASLKRHLSAFEKGEDYDSETGLLHIDHLQCNAHFLSAYYKIAPQYDDRQHTYLQHKRIGLDIDEVLCNWVEAWCTKFNYKIPEVWFFSYKNKEHFKHLSESGELNEFYLNLEPKIDPNTIPFEPHCYITSRSIPDEITKLWLQKNGFPAVPVISVGFGESKVNAAIESGVDLFVDDSYRNFVELNNAGICTYLYDCLHNKRYNVGYKRIYNLNELT
jgi:uncharacterized HAD superfamily protein